MANCPKEAATPLPNLTDEGRERPSKTKELHQMGQVQGKTWGSGPLCTTPSPAEPRQRALCAVLAGRDQEQGGKIPGTHAADAVIIKRRIKNSEVLVSRILIRSKRHSNRNHT